MSVLLPTGLVDLSTLPNLPDIPHDAHHQLEAVPLPAPPHTTHACRQLTTRHQAAPAESSNSKAPTILYTLCGRLAVRLAARRCAGLYSRPTSDLSPRLPAALERDIQFLRPRRGRCLTTLHLSFIPPSPTTFLPFGDGPPFCWYIANSPADSSFILCVCTNPATPAHVG